MLLKKIKIHNYKKFDDFILEFDNNYSIMIGNNGAGKSTLLEAIHLALTGTINGKPIFYELSPYIFNRKVVNQFIEEVKADNKITPPETKIELYFSLSEDSDLNELMGLENSENINVPGFVFFIKFNEHYREEYLQYIENENFIHLPTEYYSVEWRSFAGKTITTRSIPVKSHLIDSTTTSLAASSQKYIMNIISDVLDEK